MRQLLHTSLTILLITFVMGCSRTATDHRLVLADSLMWTAPDSALHILNAINRDSLQDDENQAYHALLLTQARFRVNYYDYPSDSLINIALDHYSDNHNREHHTRALLYKGAYYEVHDNPTQAMRYYKQAEENADTTDYRNLAQINIRMGKLYYDNFASNNLDLEKFEKALYYYERLGDRPMIMISMYYCGNVARITRSKLAMSYYQRALSLASQLNDSSSIFDINVDMALMCIEDSSYSSAKKHIFDAFKMSGIGRENTNYYMLSLIYTKMGMLDSAKYFISVPEQSQNSAYDSLMMFNALKEMAIAEGRIAQYKEFYNSYKTISNSLEYNNTKYRLHDFETDFNSTKTHNTNVHIGRLNHSIVLLGFVVFLLAVVCSIFFLKKKRDFKKLIGEIQKGSTDRFNNLDNDLAQLDNRFASIMTTQINALKKIMSQSYGGELTGNGTSTIKHKVQPIDDGDINFWNGLYDYLNLKYNNIINNIKKEYPQLPPKDLNVIGLLCCGFNDAEIAVCKGYKNDKTVKTRRSKIKERMNLDCSLVEYLHLKMKN